MSVPTKKWLEDVRFVCAYELSPCATYLTADEIVPIIDSYFELQNEVERLRGVLERIDNIASELQTVIVTLRR